MSEKQLTRAYQGRIPAKAMIENGVLWVPIAHHIDGVFENRETCTTITFERAEGELAEETLSLADEYRTLREQAERQPHPGEYFTLKEISTLPQGIGEPVERAGWQVYTPGDAIYASHSDDTQGQPHILYYRLEPRDAEIPAREALERFERSIVEHGRLRIRLKQVNEQMRQNANTLRASMQ